MSGASVAGRPASCRIAPARRVGSLIFLEYDGTASRQVTMLHELGHMLTWPHSFTGRFYIDVDGVKAASSTTTGGHDGLRACLATRSEFRTRTRGACRRRPRSSTATQPDGCRATLPPSTAADELAPTKSSQRLEGLQLLAVPGQPVDLPDDRVASAPRLRRRLPRRRQPSRGGPSARPRNRRTPTRRRARGEQARLLPARPSRTVCAASSASATHRVGEVRLLVARTSDGFRVRVSRGRAKLPRTIPASA